MSLSELPHITTHKTKLGKWVVFYHQAEEYHWLRREIFTRQPYAVTLANTTNPYIIDAGAYVGLASLYFLSRYPQATITALEPHPVVYELLSQTVWENRLETQIEPLAAALTPTDHPATLYFDDTTDQWWSTSSLHSGGWTGLQQTTKLQVPGISLTTLLDRPVDLLKLDIEGAEFSVLQAAKQRLSLVHTIVCEFHPIPNQPALADFVSLLRAVGFSVASPTPAGDGLWTVVATRQ